jgi:hypothetical protein
VFPWGIGFSQIQALEPTLTAASELGALKMAPATIAATRADRLCAAMEFRIEVVFMIFLLISHFANCEMIIWDAARQQASASNSGPGQQQ